MAKSKRAKIGSVKGRGVIIGENITAQTIIVGAQAQNYPRLTIKLLAFPSSNLVVQLARDKDTDIKVALESERRRHGIPDQEWVVDALGAMTVRVKEAERLQKERRDEATEIGRLIDMQDAIRDAREPIDDVERYCSQLLEWYRTMCMALIYEHHGLTQAARTVTLAFEVCNEGHAPAQEATIQLKINAKGLSTDLSESYYPRPKVPSVPESINAILGGKFRPMISQRESWYVPTRNVSRGSPPTALLTVEKSDAEIIYRGRLGLLEHGSCQRLKQIAFSFNYHPATTLSCEAKLHASNQPEDGIVSMPIEVVEM